MFTESTSSNYSETDYSESDFSISIPNLSTAFDQSENEEMSQYIDENEEMSKYIDDKEKIYSSILEFLENLEDNDEDNENYFEKLTKTVDIQKIFESNDEIQQFLRTIEKIFENHHRDKIFIEKVYKILQHYKDKIKQSLSNNEIYRIFADNKLLLLYLLEKSVINFTEEIYKEIINKIEPNGLRFCYFFYPELEKFVGEESMKDVKNELLLIDPNIFEDFIKKRQEGENNSYICSLIRQDSVEEFISYINRRNYSLSGTIEPSLFETNSFLIENNKISLAEYSCFYGSIQIFQYLFMNNVKLTTSLWLYTIHSNNPELIHFLETNKVHPPEVIIEKKKKRIIYKNNYVKCFTESIKCHHNDIANYVKNNLLNEEYPDQKEDIVSSFLKYHNFAFFEKKSILKQGFFYLCLYNYNELVNLLLKMNEATFKMLII